MRSVQLVAEPPSPWTNSAGLAPVRAAADEQVAHLAARPHRAHAGVLGQRPLRQHDGVPHAATSPRRPELELPPERSRDVAALPDGRARPAASTSTPDCSGMPSTSTSGRDGRVDGAQPVGPAAARPVRQHERRPARRRARARPPGRRGRAGPSSRTSTIAPALEPDTTPPAASRSVTTSSTPRVRRASSSRDGRAAGQHEQPGPAQHRERRRRGPRARPARRRRRRAQRPEVPHAVVVGRGVLAADRAGQRRHDHRPAGPAQQVGVHLAAVAGRTPPRPAGTPVRSRRRG